MVLVPVGLILGLGLYRASYRKFLLVAVAPLAPGLSVPSPAGTPPSSTGAVFRADFALRAGCGAHGGDTAASTYTV